MRKTCLTIFLILLLIGNYLQAEEYYWVGGTGYWSDLNHWRTSNNQIPNEVPDANDNVTFNEYSFLSGFDTVYIQTGNPTCKDMTWLNLTGPVCLYGGGSTVSFDIYGSITLHPKLRNKYHGKITFLSNQPGNTISCSGSNFPGNLIFEGGGEWILQDTLIVLDTSDWRYVFNSGIWYSGNQFLIQHLNGKLDVNEQAIIGGTFVTGSSNPCDLDLENGQAYLLNSWTLNGQNMNFDGTNSYIYVGSELTNQYGSNIYYNDVDVKKSTGTITNTGIHSFFRKVHFLSGGKLNGVNNGSVMGSFTIDTLLFSGSYLYLNNPYEARITGVGHDIHYTRIDTLIARINVSESTIHRIDIHGICLGNLFEGIPSIIKGNDNTFDTLMIRNTPCRFIGGNIVTGLIQFDRESVISATAANENLINHAVFGSNGFIEGNNEFNILTLATGYLYKLQADSLTQPGSYHTDKFVQSIGLLEVTGNCNLGVTMLTSDYRPIQAVINYTGGPLETEYLQIRDIKNIGTTMTISNGIDAGNNEGVIFTDPILPRTLYWVNGQGLWSDIGHWSLTSGGIAGECPPTRLDDVFFDGGSGFDTSEDTVLVRSPHIHCNNMTWVDGFTHIVHFVSADTGYQLNYVDTLQIWVIDTLLLTTDTCTLHIMGSVELDPMLSLGFDGDVYYESEYDNDFETIDLEWYGQRYNFRNKSIFDGSQGKWKIPEGAKFYNPNDSVIFRQGELLFTGDTVEVFNFIAIDTLPRRLTLLDQTLFVVHQWSSNAWNVNASSGLNGNSLFEFDAGKSTIRSMGDFGKISGANGQCNIKTSGNPLTYNNIEFGFPLGTSGQNSGLISNSNCTYNRVDYFYMGCNASGSGTIDSLTWHPTSDHSFLIDDYSVNVVMAYGTDNALYGSQVIDTAIFFEDAVISGNHVVGYLQTEKTLSIDSMNVIDTAMILGNTEFAGKNVFSKLTLGPGSRYIFMNNESLLADSTVIEDDLIVEGFCDEPIRLQSNSPGKQAEILYKALNPSIEEYTANYTSVRDIAMLPWDANQYLALNSVDLGNNENWIFDQQDDDTYYWIGGTGNWGDWQHWSNSSGGPPLAQECIPREIVSVVFDNNSFEQFYDTVFVDVSNAYCKNMWWKFDTSNYSPCFISSDSSSLFVYGSMMLKEALRYEFKGEVYFDQYNEPGNLPDTLYSRGAVFLNDVYFQGQGDAIILDDSMSLSVPERCILHHLYGDFSLNGKKLITGGFHSSINSERMINMNNAIVTVNYTSGRALWLEGENLDLHSENCTLINNSMGGSIVLMNGGFFSFDNIIISGDGDSLLNKNNNISYGLIKMNGEANLVTGTFNADSILIRGDYCAISKYGNINVVIFDGANGSIYDNQKIKRCFFNKPGKVSGQNEINYCVFIDDGTFLGHNVFDTLVLYPGQGNTTNQGNWFYFQVDSVQTINDSLYMRGNQCSNMNIATFPPYSSIPAYIRKDHGNDVSCDFLNIYNVGAVSSGGLNFYAGSNSTPLPDPNNPPPGWIFENAQGYIPGFNGRTERFCAGDTFLIDAGDFNGGPSTQYFWNGSTTPGDLLYPTTTPGTYTIEVVYFEGCSVSDYIILEEDQPPVANIPAGPFCAGEMIQVEVTPVHDDYTYQWWNGETSGAVEAKLEYSGPVSVLVTDTVTTCTDNPSQDILVKPTPNPETSLGSDTTIKFGEYIMLDAGEGDYYAWSSDPFVTIENPDERQITVPGYGEPVEYLAYVEIDGCGAEGYKIVSMYPRSTLGIPTAFSPNGDGVNDELKILGSGFNEVEFMVYNRYGQKVFETTDPSIGWDGTFQGVDQPVEVYTWIIRVEFADREVMEDSGNVSLLR